MNHRNVLSVIVLPFLGTGACTSSLHHAPFGYAEPVADWEGIRNIARDGNVYFAGQPTEEALGEAAERDIKIVVNLRGDREMASSVDFDESSLVENLGMDYVSIPVMDVSLADADRLRDVLNGTPGPVLIHCGSANRVGALWALYLHRHRGVGLDAAIDRGRKAGMRNPALIEKVRTIAGDG